MRNNIVLLLRMAYKSRVLKLWANLIIGLGVEVLSNIACRYFRRWYDHYFLLGRLTTGHGFSKFDGVFYHQG